MRIPAAILVSLLITSCGQQVEKRDLPTRLDDTVQFFNDNLERMKPPELGNAKFSAYAEGGDILVVKMENVPTGNEIMDPDVMRRLLRPKVCETESGRSFIEAGGKVRIEWISHTGYESPPSTLARC